MRTAISGCKITYFVHQVNTKQYELGTKSQHEKTTQAVWKVLPWTSVTLLPFLRAIIPHYFKRMQDGEVLQFLSTHYKRHMYTRVNKKPLAWNFLSPKPEVTCGTVAIIIRVVLLSPCLRIRVVSLSSIHYNQSHRVYINRRRQYICLIWN